MSGVGARGFFSLSRAYADTVATAFLTQLGINTTDPDEAHQQLIDTPLDHILRVNRLLLEQSGVTTFFPVVETSFPGVTTMIEKEPEELVSEGKGKDIPMLIGFAEAECELFRARFEEIGMMARIKANPVVTLPPYMIFKTSTEKLPEKVAAVSKKYFSNGTSMDSFLRCCTDAYFIYPAMYTAQRRIDVGGVPPFLYQF